MERGCAPASYVSCIKLTWHLIICEGTPVGMELTILSTRRIYYNAWYFDLNQILQLVTMTLPSQAKVETRALKAKRPGFTDERYNETSYFMENGTYLHCHQKLFRICSESDRRMMIVGNVFFWDVTKSWDQLILDTRDTIKKVQLFDQFVINLTIHCQYVMR